MDSLPLTLPEMHKKMRNWQPWMYVCMHPQDHSKRFNKLQQRYYSCSQQRNAFTLKPALKTSRRQSVHFRNKITAQLLQKVCISWYQNVHYGVHKSPSLVPIQSQLNLVHNFILNFFTANLIPHALRNIPVTRDAVLALQCQEVTHC
jgi:hypothetical protein